MDVLNVRVWDPELESYDGNAAELLTEAWKATRWQCKMNASIGCILHHRESGRYRYFHASPNEGALYDKPKHVGSLDSLNAFIEDLAAKDVQEHAVRRRPNTEWRMYWYWTGKSATSTPATKQASPVPASRSEDGQSIRRQPVFFPLSCLGDGV